MKTQRLLEIAGWIMVLAVAFGVGAWLGYSHGIRTTLKVWVEDVLDREVRSYRQLQAGETSRLQKASGQCVQDFLRIHNRAFSDSPQPPEFKQVLSEAGRINKELNEAEMRRVLEDADMVPGAKEFMERYRAE